MKRISEVFNLPTTPNDFIVSDSVAVNSSGFEAEQYASHAINHVDALADALVSAAKLIDNLGMVSSDEYQEIVAAISAYRGEK